MKIRVVSSREEIFTLNPNERIVHLAFRPSNKDIFGLVETCPKVEVFSYLNLTGARSQSPLICSLRCRESSLSKEMSGVTGRI